MTPKATKASARQDPFLWLKPEQFQELLKRGNAAGPKTHLEWRGTGTDTRFRVVDPDAIETESHTEDINHAQGCPINCP